MLMSKRCFVFVCFESCVASVSHALQGSCFYKSEPRTSFHILQVSSSCVKKRYWCRCFRFVVIFNRRHLPRSHETDMEGTAREYYSYS